MNNNETPSNESAEVATGRPPTKALLNDLASAEHDVLSLAQRHSLTLGALVDWACEHETRRTVAGLCVLADAQTQLLLSRYRLVAATRLIAQATAEDDTLSAEQVRKACVDLLKTELTRAASLEQHEDAEEDAAFDALARAMSVPEQDLVATSQSSNTEPTDEPN